MAATVFLDVDGVLSPWSEGSQAWDDWEAMPYSSYSLPLSRSMAARVGALAARIVWFTTWGNLANSQVGAHLGWSEREVVELRPAETSAKSKVEALRRAIPSCSGPVVVVDDDPEVQAEARELLLGHQALFIQPDPNVGLTRDQLGDIERFLASCADEEGIL